MDGLSLEDGRVHVEGADDVGVADLLPDLRLAEEPLEEALARRQVGVDNLERDLLPGVDAGGPALADGPVDPAHAAGAQLLHQAVGPDATEVRACNQGRRATRHHGGRQGRTGLHRHPVVGVRSSIGLRCETGVLRRD
jgi:hypothetical protein